MDDANYQQEENSREIVENSGLPNEINNANEATKSNENGQFNVSEPTDDIKQTRRMQQVAQYVVPDIHVRVVSLCRLAKYSLPNSDLQEDNLLTYGKVAPNTHVKSIQFSRKRWAIDMEMPVVKTMQFAMLVDTSIYIWDIENESAPVYTKKVCSDSQSHDRNNN